jgi:hypothetical protein
MDEANRFSAGPQKEAICSSEREATSSSNRPKELRRPTAKMIMMMVRSTSQSVRISPEAEILNKFRECNDACLVSDPVLYK